MSPFFTPGKPEFLLFLVWTLFWKGCAMWFAAKEDKRGWFLALFVINLGGLLEIIYIFHFAKKKWSDIQALFKAASKRKAEESTENNAEAKTE